MKPLEAMAVAAVNKCGYPEPFRSRCMPREKRKLGEAFGLKTVGINLTTLSPGKESSMRHWHTREDEFIYVLEGELTLRTDEGDRPLRAGMCVGFPGGAKNGHQVINLSAAPARYLEIGTRDDADIAHYSDVDLALDAAGDYFHKDGTPY